MSSKEIRELEWDGADQGTYELLREIAAQLAEANELKRKELEQV